MTHKLFIEYQKLFHNEEFIQLFKKLSFQLNSELGKDLNEVETVKNWIDLLNKTKDIKIQKSNISFNSVFIHGYNHSEQGSYPSGVEFDYINNQVMKRELADIIFISSFYDQKKKILEKISLNQVKKGNIQTTTSSWKIDKKQLFLLSNFPRFSGVNGSFIPNNDFYIEDYSKGLGSYGLLTTENFIYISANIMRDLIGGKKSINQNDLKSLGLIQNNLGNLLIDDYWFCDYERCSFSQKYCNSTYDFIMNFLCGRIGEVIIGDFFQNASARNLLHNILSSISKFAKSQTSTEEILNFIGKYGDFNEDDNRGINNYLFSGNLGIVQMNIRFNNNDSE